MVVISKESTIGTGTTGGVPRLISIDGTKFSSLGWYRNGCYNDSFVVRYYDVNSTNRRPKGNVSNFCDSWLGSTQENTVVYEKLNETLTVTLNGTKIGEYTDLHPTLNNISSETKFLTNISGYTSSNIYIKSLSVELWN